MFSWLQMLVVRHKISISNATLIAYPQGITVNWFIPEQIIFFVF